MRFIKAFIIIYLLTIISCSPSLGASWYAKSGKGSGGVSMYVTSIKVLDKDVTVSDPDYRATEKDALLNFARAKRFSIAVPYNVKVLDIDSLKVEVYADSKRQRPIKFRLEIEGDSVPLVAGEAVSVTLRVKDDAGRYETEEKFISVTREMSSDPNEKPSEPEPEVPDEPEPPELENPVDENGHKKFKVKINIKKEKIDPFKYYGKDYAFPSNRFDGWILNMTSMANDNVASYAFKDGQWSGSPLSCTGDDIGQGQKNETKNLKYYKYSTQEERWLERGGYNSSINEEEKKNRERFVFFRFTGTAGGGIVKLDNSMFCLDTHSKFLFYYSDPANINLVGVPSNWKDYDEADEGYHKHFEKPFYLTDPIGYVKDNGECVIYTWCKQHIMANNYTATVDKTYRKQASRSPSGKGYSPYRDEKIKTTKERITEENPEYTAEKPVIKGQSGSIYLSIDSPEEAKLSVTVKPAPEGEELSFQWYKNTTPSKEGGEAIDGATVAEYTMEKKVIDVYCYCVVTNKNTKNNKEAKSISQPIKVRIAQSAAELKIDAETPIITKHPKSSKHSFVEGKKIEISLSVEAIKQKSEGVLSYQWFESATEDVSNGTKIENATGKIYKAEISSSGFKYYYCVVTNTNNNATGAKSVSVVSALAKIEIEGLYELTFSCVGDGILTAFGGEEGTKSVKDGSEGKIKVKIGTDLVFIAKPKAGWEIEKWEGKVIHSGGNLNTVQLKIEKAEDVAEPISVLFTKIQKKGKIGITDVSIENLTLGGQYYTNNNAQFGYFDWDIRTSFQDDSLEHSYFSIWNDNKCLYLKGKGASVCSMPSSSIVLKDIQFYNKKPELKLDIKLVKHDEHGFIKNHYQNVSDYDQSTVEFEYDDLNDCWRVKDVNFNIDKVTVNYNKKFKLHRGQELPFVITYEVNNSSNYAVGNVKVVYTLLWE